MTDFSDPDTRALYDREVKKRVDEFGMTIDQAQMLVAVLMTDRGKSGEVLLPIKSGEVLPPIKPCPFCGAPASVEEFPSAIGEAAFSVGCDSAEEASCPGYQSLTTFSRRSDAVAAWNRRIP